MGRHFSKVRGPRSYWAPQTKKSGGPGPPAPRFRRLWPIRNRWEEEGHKSLSEIAKTRRLRLTGHGLRLPDASPAGSAMRIGYSSLAEEVNRQKTWRSSFLGELYEISVIWEYRTIVTAGGISSPTQDKRKSKQVSTFVRYFCLNILLSTRCSVQP